MDIYISSKKSVDIDNYGGTSFNVISYEYLCFRNDEAFLFFENKELLLSEIEIKITEKLEFALKGIIQKQYSDTITFNIIDALGRKLCYAGNIVGDKLITERYSENEPNSILKEVFIRLVKMEILNLNFKIGVYESIEPIYYQENHGGVILTDYYHQHICFYPDMKKTGLYGGGKNWLKPYTDNTIEYIGKIISIKEEKINFFIYDKNMDEKIFFVGIIKDPNTIEISSYREKTPNTIWVQDTFTHITDKST